MSALVPVPVLLPLLGAALSILVGRSRTAQRVIGVTVLTSVTAVSAVLLVSVDRDGPLVVQAGDWSAPLGITLVADRLATIMLTIGSVMLLSVLVYAIGQPGAERNHVGFQSVYLILAAGVAASFLAGDLFNLFVSFEMMLTASYVLLTLGGAREQVRSGMTYVVISLLASALFVTLLALLYTATGTVNMADLAERVPDLPDGLQSGFAVLLVVVFGIKAALFPLFFWLPDSYPTAPSAVTAVFAGLLTKVGVYAILRTQTLFFDDGARAGTLLLVMAGATMLVGILGAIAQDDVDRILSFNIVSHIGFMIMGVGLFTVAGTAAGILYVIHHIVAMTTLFLAAGLIEHIGGSSRLTRLGGMVRTAPVVAWLFLIPALGLAGVPPLSGFAPKLALIDAGLVVDQHLIVGVSLLVSLLTLYSMVKIWSAAFWSPVGETPEREVHAAGRLGGPPLMVLPTVVLVVLSLGIAVAAGPLFDLSQRTAEDLLDSDRYVEAVLG